MTFDNSRNRYLKNVESTKKPLRYSQDSFVRELIGKVLKITLVNGKEIQGRLQDLGMFDIKVQTSEAQIIIMKSAILTVEVY